MIPMDGSSAALLSILSTQGGQPEAKVTPIWRALIVEVSPLPQLKYSLNLGRKTPKLYMTPSPMRLPMKQANTAIQPQNPPSGAATLLILATRAWPADLETIGR